VSSSEEPIRDEPQPFFVKHRSSAHEAVIECGGECDAGAIDELNRLLGEVVAAQPERVIVDLGQTSFVDSVTLGAFMAAAKRVRTRGGSFEVVGATAAEVRRAFEITGLDRHLLADASP
jgi:anti-sigma B factor antagonist